MHIFKPKQAQARYFFIFKHQNRGGIPHISNAGPTPKEGGVPHISTAGPALNTYYYTLLISQNQGLFYHFLLS